MPSDANSKLSSRLNMNKRRIWFLVGGILTMVVLTRWLNNVDGTGRATHRLVSTDLKPKNYFNGTAAGIEAAGFEDSPFEFCPLGGERDELGRKYGALNLSKTRLHLGSSARVQKVINKALSGLPVTISVLGGSVSSCHGAGNDPLSPACYPSKFFNWWNSVFPHPASELTNGAMRRTNSDYFSFCNAHHVPDVTDLVIVELDTEDRVDATSRENFETLIRALLIRLDHPAVLILGHFSPQTQQQHGFAGADNWHSVVAQFYDIPHISTKPILYPDYIENPSSINRYYADAVLANPSGHDILSDVLIAYIQSQTCSAWAAATGRSLDTIPAIIPHIAVDNVKQPTDAKGLFGGVGQRKGGHGTGENKDALAGAAAPGNRPASKQGSTLGFQQVPKARIGTRPDDGNFEEIAPFCASANDLVNPLPPSVFAGTGWSAYHPPTGSNALSSTSHYWYSSIPQSKFRVTVALGAGDVGVYYLMEPKTVVGNYGSVVSCWVDDNYGGRVEIGNAGDVGEPTPTLRVIDRGVAWGSHYVECQLEGDEDDRNIPSFRILGIFAT